MKRFFVPAFLCLMAGCGGGDAPPAPAADTPPSAPPPVAQPTPQTGAQALAPLVAWADVPDWETFQGNAGHTGHVPVRLDPGRFSPRWRWDAPETGSPDDRISTVVTGSGQVFAAVGNRLYARSEYDGSGTWSRDFGDLAYPSANPPAVSGGIVYIVAGHSTSTRLYALAAADGTQRFATSMASQWESYLAPTVADGRVYAGGGKFGGLYAFDFLTGNLAWFAERTQADQWTPAAANGLVYTYTDVLTVAGAYDGHAQGTPIPGTAFPYTGAPVDGAPVLGANGTVFALNGAMRDNALLRFDTSQSRLAWSVTGQYAGNPAYADGRVYALARAPLRLEVRAEADATLLWEWAPPLADAADFLGDALLTDNLVFVSTTRAVFAIDLASHQAVWRFPAPGRLALSANAVLYVANARTLTALNVR